MNGAGTIILALTDHGTLYAAIPQPDAAFRIRRYRPYGPRSERDRTFEGTVSSVMPIDHLNPPPPEAVVCCGGTAFQMEPRTAGAPLPNLRMVVGRKDTHREVTSPVRWVGRLDASEDPDVDALFQAYMATSRHEAAGMLREAA